MKKLKYKKDFNSKLILGINGWYEGAHNASISIIESSKLGTNILIALEEEKVIGKKNIFDVLPINAIKVAFECLGINDNDIDEIVFGWDYPLLYKSLSKNFSYTEKQIKKDLFGNENNESKLSFINHHRSHASSAYRVSNFEEALIVVIDGAGENESTTVWQGKGTKIKKLDSFPVESSLGFLFEATNIMIGFGEIDSGKTMGLAAYGDPIYYDILCRAYEDGNLKLKKDLIKIYNRLKVKYTDNVNSYQQNIIKMWLIYFNDKLGLKINKIKIKSFYDVPKQYKDLAASVQKLLEEKIDELLKNYFKKDLKINLCIAGGVGLNCKMNGEVLMRNFDKINNIFIQPAANDAGVSIGSALELHEEKIDKIFSPFLGVEYTNDEIIKFLNENNISYKFYDDCTELIGNNIYQNKIIALFQGRNEFGPRALGNRTLLANPKKENLDLINKSIKNRELGRPLCPSLCEDDYNIFGINTNILGRYMNLAYYTINQLDNEMAVIHVDNTFRPQFVDRKLNLTYYTQLSKIATLKGNSIVINTSFNNDTPIVFTLKQAINFWNQKNIDLLIFNNNIVLEKN